MAFHGPSYGLDAELASKMASKRDPKMEQEVIEFVSAVTGRPITDLHEDLKDGQALCEYVSLATLVEACLDNTLVVVRHLCAR
jgi:hypothetical protein